MVELWNVVMAQHEKSIKPTQGQLVPELNQQQIF